MRRPFVPAVTGSGERERAQMGNSSAADANAFKAAAAAGQVGIDPDAAQTALNKIRTGKDAAEAPLSGAGTLAPPPNIVDSARGRSDGFDMGSDRAIANPPNWNAQASQQLYNGAVNNNDPGTAEATGHAWAHHGTELKQASDHLYNAISELGNAWVGKGAAGAQGALVAIANSGSQASEAAHTMSDR